MEHESTEPGPASAAAGDGIRGPQAVAGIGRRRLLRAGIGAAPVLMTLHSGPVSATNVACTVASSFVSAATFASRSPGTTYITCSSTNAGNWRDYCNNVPQNLWCAGAAAQVKDHLCSTSSPYNTWRCGDVLKTGGGLASSGNLAVLQRILGLTLTMDHLPSNITTAGAPGGSMDKAYLAGVWSQYCSTGRYSVPADNVDWDEAGLIRWLNMLQYSTPIA